MSPTEFAFLALGLVLGIAVGAAVAEIVRARPAPRREVRLTVSPNSIAPRRAATLSSADRPTAGLPASGGPAADAMPEPWLDAGSAGADGPGPTSAPSTPARTPVPSVGLPVMAPGVVGAPRQGNSAVAWSTPGGPAVPVGPAPARTPRPEAPPSPPDPVARAAPFMLDRDPRPAVQQASERAASVAVVVEPPPAAAPTAAPAASPVLPASLDVGERLDHREVRVRPAAAPGRITLTAGALGLPIGTPAEPRPTAEVHGAGDDPARQQPATSTAASGPEARDTAAGPCADERRLASERCGLADHARGQAAMAAGALREAQRAYDGLRDRVDHLERVADPREIRAAKDTAHRTFREARAAAASGQAADEAARAWLAEINRLNTEASAAREALVAGREELAASIPRLERLALEADAGRITAEAAEATCREAREALASCEEAAVAAARASTPHPEPEPVAAGWPVSPDPGLDELRPDDGVPAAHPPRILRLLRGDRAARETLVAELSGGDPEQARTWRLALADLVDAIVARAIEDGQLEVSDRVPFWAMFEPTERHHIVTALSALGFRFDGLGGFADDRVPAARDLSLAIGYAGLDPMRVRRWPRDDELPNLFVDTTVAAGAWLTGAADDLALGRMVDALGHRAADLADVWNAWGRLRPLLLASD